jgi:flagellar biosynthesis/type III secretory pathway protein FliH
MAKSHTKPQGNPNIPQNYPNHTPKLDSVKLSKIQEQSRSIYPKSKQQIDKEYYQKNKEKKKQQRRERYQQGKEQAELDTQQLQAKYYTAEAIKILMSFKEYTELNKDKMKL